MKTETPSMRRKSDQDWFRQAFSDDYLFLYSHRDDSEAQKHVEMAIQHVPFAAGQCILDIACGNGRHLQAFAQLGARVTGVDLSETMLGQAKKRFKKMKLSVRLEKRDMRDLCYREEFDGVTMWFTSFGYFENAEEDRLVLQNISQVLKPGAWWWIDLPNPDFLIASLVPKTIRSITGPHGDAQVIEKRFISGDRVEKIIEISDITGTREYTESVRLYRAEIFGKMLQDNGLVAKGTLGDYTGSAFTKSSPRQIWFGGKAAGGK